MPSLVNFISNSINEIPVTMSAFKSGMLVAPSISAFCLLFILWIPIAASVPSRVATIEATSVMVMVCLLYTSG